MGKFPNWDRPKLTETQLNGEEKRLAPRGLFPEQVRANLICALASMEATSCAAACRALAEAIEVSDSLIDNCLNGRMPIYDTFLNGLYGTGRGSSLPVAWTDPTDFGPLLAHAIAAGLAPDWGVATPEPTLSPDPGAGAPSPPVIAPAPEIVALAPHPPAPSDDLPAVAATTVPAPAPELDQSAEIAAPPAFSSEPVSLRAPDAANRVKTIEPVQPREVAAAGEGPPLPPNPPAPAPVNILAVAQTILAGRLNAAIEEAAAARRRYELAELHARNLATTVAELRRARQDFTSDRAAA